MTPRRATRLRNIPPYAFEAIDRRVREIENSGHAVIRLDMGSPDLPPPVAVIEALFRSAQDARNHGYGGFSGTPQLRKAFAEYYAQRFEVQLDADEEVLPLIGSKEGIVNICLALANPGDVILIPDLAYPAYAAGAYLAGAYPCEFHLSPGNSYMPDLDSIAPDILANARLLWINYPHNPTGAVASINELEKVVRFCEQHSILLCADNPYADIAFDGNRPHSILEVEGSMNFSVEFNSLSKTYNMAGWRLGVCVGNRDMIDALLTVKSNIDSGIFKALQDAAFVALTETSPDWIAARNAVYEQRRDTVLTALHQIGLRANKPKAGIYVWAEVLDGDDEGYVRKALETAHVSLTPGRVYGSAGHGFVRFSLVKDNERIKEAMDRLRHGFQ